MRRQETLQHLAWRRLAKEAVRRARHDESLRADGSGRGGHRHWRRFDSERLEHHLRTDRLIAEILG